MSAETQAIRIPEKIMRQIRSDSHAALLRARICPSSTDAVQLRCIEFRRESESEFGSQLWYFDAHGVFDNPSGDPQRSGKLPVYGVLEYSIQYGLHELAEDGVFDSVAERERYHSVYRRGHFVASLWHPMHRWLALGVLLVALAVLIKWLPQLFAA